MLSTSNNEMESSQPYIFNGSLAKPPWYKGVEKIVDMII